MEGYFYKNGRRSKYKKFWKISTWYKVMRNYRKAGYEWREMG